MWKARIGWAIWLAGCLTLCLLGSGTGAILLLGVSAVVPLLMGLLTWLFRRKLVFTLTEQVTVRKAAEASCRIDAGNRGMLPCLCMEAVLLVENLLTRETSRQVHRFAVPARGESEASVELTSPWCGKVTVRAERVCIYDWCRLFRFELPVTEDGEAFVLFLPETFVPVVDVVSGASQDLDSDEFSMQKPGFDPSETFAIREYRAGDRLNKIHWKLSEKLDHLMIREAGLPIKSSVLFLWDTWVESPQKADAGAETVISLAQVLLAGEVRMTICWLDAERGTLEREVLESPESLTGALGRLLSVGTRDAQTDVLETYTEQEDPAAYAHIVVVTERMSEALGRLSSGGSRVSVLYCGQEAGGENRDFRVFSYLPDSRERDLAYVEI